MVGKYHMSKVNLFLDDEDVDLLLNLLTDRIHHLDKQTPEFPNVEKLMLVINGQRSESSKFVEKANEFKEVAALVCMDLDLLNDIASDTSLTADKLRKQIEHTVKQKDEMIADASVRSSRYSAASMLFSLPPGSIRSDKVR